MATKTPAKSNSLLMLEEQFANDVGKATGIDPRVIFAQSQAEGAYAPNGTGGLNFLNLKSATVASIGAIEAGSTSAGFAQFSSLGQAESATIAEYKSPAIHVVPGITPQADITAISASPWDQGHYLDSHGNNKLTTTFAQDFGKAALTQPKLAGKGVIVDPALARAFQKGPGSGLTPGTGSIAAGAIAPITATAQFLGKITDPANILRGMEIVAGGVLILLGLVVIVIGGKGTPASQTARAVRTVTA